MVWSRRPWAVVWFVQGRAFFLRPPSVKDEGEADAEEGRIGVLMAVLVMIVLIACLVAANIAAVHLQHRRLLACADAVALAASGNVDAHPFYSSGGQNLEVNPAWALGVTQQRLVDLSASTCRVGEGVQVVSVTRSVKDVVVEVRAVATLPLVPPFVNELLAPRLQESGAAVMR
ncbi:hypothetical protein [Schaalia sp. Marseille-Q2122]|uniref:hypothetical protein n=1 Tax=Schaalia sp. Marseille-Q2122 TaxID=2736604 RepID=UPI00158A07B9|nr:hypothetical protein [Schaalia sp. Marseille-Q2122]